MRISDWSLYVCSSDLLLPSVSSSETPAALIAYAGVLYNLQVGTPRAALAVGRCWTRPCGGIRLRALTAYERLATEYDRPLRPDADEDGAARRSEERRVGTECVGQFRSRWSQ